MAVERISDLPKQGIAHGELVGRQLVFLKIGKQQLHSVITHISYVHAVIGRDLVLEAQHPLFDVWRGPEVLHRVRVKPDVGQGTLSLARRQDQATGEGITQQVLGRDAVHRADVWRGLREARQAQTLVVAELHCGDVEHAESGAHHQLRRHEIGQPEARREVGVLGFVDATPVGLPRVNQVPENVVSERRTEGSRIDGIRVGEVEPGVAIEAVRGRGLKVITHAQVQS